MFKINCAGPLVLALLAGCAGGAVPQKDTAPAWVTSPAAAFGLSEYLYAVGHGSERETAEKNALTSLGGLFGQTIQGEQTTITRYSEAVLNGAADHWTEDTSLVSTIKTYVDIQFLIGAEIRDYWYDGKKTHYALAVMERTKSALLYGGMIRSNEKLIEKLISMTPAEKNSIDGYFRYRLAGTVAGANRVFSNVLSVIGASVPAGGAVANSESYLLEAANIAKDIPITVKAANDKSGRIAGAFAAAVNKAGFRSGDSVNARYLIDAEMIMSQVELSGQSNKFVRYTLDAKLIDTAARTVVLPYTISGREGHLTVAEAENRAYSVVEQRIGEEYETLLSEHFRF